MSPRQPPIIRQLSELVANQIAAGEVVERPAAVAKELAENSLDAGATRVIVRCEDGGRRLIEVVDDGHGMRPDDLVLALGRHATSKLQDADDLFRIATLGFRGEALPSLAAVSEFELASRPHDADVGALLSVSAGAPAKRSLCAMAPGTRVSVRNLFWNVPARLKFLKNESAEAGHVTEQVIRLALGHPQVAFRLELDGRVVLDLAAGHDLVQRARELFGAGFADRLIPVQGFADGLQVSGFIAHPSEAKPTAKRQYLFLNGRHVRDKLLIAAVREGYSGFLEPRLHGAVLLHLDLNPELVDVNVHPTKAEVRFRREGEVFSTLAKAIQAGLKAKAGGFALLPNAVRPGNPSADSQFQASGFARTVVKEAAPPAMQERYLPATPLVTPRTEPARAAEPVAIYQTAAPATPAAQHLPNVRRVLQLHDMYLLIETDTGIRIVDQHALHEKALWLALDPKTGDLLAQGVQELLVPRSIGLSAAEVATVEPMLAGLAERGIRAEVFGPTTLLLRAYPAVLKRTDWVAFFTGLAAGTTPERACERLSERIGHCVACHAAVKAGQRLSADEQLELVRLLFTLDGAEHCPHGRPTTLDLGWGELARRFQR